MGRRRPARPGGSKARVFSVRWLPPAIFRSIPRWRRYRWPAPAIQSERLVRTPPRLLAQGGRSRAALPLCFLNGSVIDLIGFDHDSEHCARADYERWIATATRKGLVHMWLTPDSAAPIVPAPKPSELDGTSPRRRISVGIDAAWLLAGESGAQVFAFELVSELAGRSDIERILLLSDSGAVPRALSHLPQVSGMPWLAAMRTSAPLVDILHRPYQPGADVDFRRYSKVARFVAMTVLDFIAYDNPAYHDSEWSWRQYQRQFDENVCLADRVFAISGYVGARLQQQFAERLGAPVQALPLGTDHLRDDGDEGTMPDAALGARSLADQRFLLVLGNDFEHKNRDFAVRCSHGCAIAATRVCW